MKTLREMFQKLVFLMPVLLLLGCTNVLLKEPFGEFVTADEMDFGVYITAEGERYLVEETEHPEEFLVTELFVEEGKRWRFKYSKLERNDDLDLELGWFFHEEHDAWAIVRIIHHGDSGTSFCMAMPHPKALKRERKETRDFKLIDLTEDSYDSTFLVEGKIKKKFWKRDSSWYGGSVMIVHKESELQKLLDVANAQALK